MKTLILYEKLFPSTEEVAKRLSLILGPANHCDIENFKEELKDFDIFILGIPLSRRVVSRKSIAFAEENKEWLKDKKVFIFFTSRDDRKQLSYINKIREYIGEALIYYKSLKVISHEIREYALEIKDRCHGFHKVLEEGKILEVMEEFIKEHNTCALGTSYQNEVRVTPVEYAYLDKEFYIITEGGEKFSNLILNNSVSLAIYEEYQGMDNLRGLQVTGKAFLIPINSEEYKKILQDKDENTEALDNYKVNINLLKIKPIKAEVLSYEFEEQGFDSKQVYYFV